MSLFLPSYYEICPSYPTSLFLKYPMEDKKQALMQVIRQELAVANATELIGKLNETCYDRCIPKPGSRFERSEQTCISKCIGRYMDAWNIIRYI